MKPRIWISELTFSDGTVVPIEKNSINVIVGPNNSGKSASLREMVTLLNNPGISATKIIKNLRFDREGDETDLINFIASLPNSKLVVDSNGESYKGYNINLHKDTAIHTWKKNKGISYFSNLFVNILNTNGRILAANPPENIDFSQSPTHPIHFLYRNDELEAQFSNYFKQAFGADLIVHRAAGNKIPLYVGEKPIPKTGQDRVSYEYIKELEKLDVLEQQGDGMRSFVGVLLNTFIADYSILFIDEPEAFLHPPQARLLGKMLAKDLPLDKELFIATHSEDFIKGLLDSDSSRVNIIRIQRDDKINHTSILSSTEIKDVWKDPLLRHSNILDGLFHSQVIICESDSDSRFYSAILSSVSDGTVASISDTLFVSSGGKHRIPTIIKALKKLNVVTKVITDFDVLNDTNPLQSLYEEKGGLWADIEKDWRMIKNAIDKQRPELEVNELKEQIEGIFSAITGKIMPKEKISAINTSLKQASAWAKAKTVGKGFYTQR